MQWIAQVHNTLKHTRALRIEVHTYIILSITHPHYTFNHTYALYHIHCITHAHHTLNRTCATYIEAHTYITNCITRVHDTYNHTSTWHIETHMRSIHYTTRASFVYHTCTFYLEVHASIIQWSKHTCAVYIVSHTRVIPCITRARQTLKCTRLSHHKRICMQEFCWFIIWLDLCVFIILCIHVTRGFVCVPLHTYMCVCATTCMHT